MKLWTATCSPHLKRTGMSLTRLRTYTNSGSLNLISKRWLKLPQPNSVSSRSWTMARTRSNISRVYSKGSLCARTKWISPSKPSKCCRLEAWKLTLASSSSSLTMMVLTSPLLVKGKVNRQWGLLVGQASTNPWIRHSSSCKGKHLIGWTRQKSFKPLTMVQVRTKVATTAASTSLGSLSPRPPASLGPSSYSNRSPRSTSMSIHPNLEGFNSAVKQAVNTSERALLWTASSLKVQALLTKMRLAATPS